MAQGKRTFLAIGDRPNSTGAHAEGNQVVTEGVGPSVTQREVVLSSVSLVAVALDKDQDRRVSEHPVRILGKNPSRLGAEIEAIGIEENILEISTRIQVSQIFGQLGYHIFGGERFGDRPVDLFLDDTVVHLGGGCGSRFRRPLS